MTPQQLKRLARAEARRPEAGESREVLLERILARYQLIADRRRAAGIPELGPAESQKVGAEFVAYMIEVHGHSPLG
jgi:hypothetical protein